MFESKKVEKQNVVLWSNM